MAAPDQSASDQSAAPGAYALAVADPGRPAIVAADQTVVTFGQLGEAANRVANALRELGVGAGDAVANLVHNSPAHFEVLLATGQIGVYLVPVNVHLTPPETAYIVADSGAKVVVAHSDLAAALAPVLDQIPAARYAIGEPVAGWRSYAELKAAGAPTPPEDRVAGTMMGYTSGTTGRPKGVRRSLPPIPPELMIGFMSGFVGQFGLQPGRGVHLVVSPLYHAAPANISLQILHLGHTLVVQPKFDAEAALRAIERHRVTSTQMVPTHLHRMLRLPVDVRERFDLSSLEVLLVAGAPFAPEVKRAVLDWLGPVVWEYLASTEGSVCTVSPQEALDHPGTVGKPPDIRILDPAGEPVPPGEAGTIYFPSLAHFDYHNDPAKTATAHAVEGFVTVGDLGRLDSDGYLYLLDRRDDLIISGGVNIYPAEIEERLSLHPGVADVAVVGAADPEWGQSVIAFVQTEPGWQAGETLIKELDEHCREALASLKCPRRYEFRTLLPRTPSGKLLRRTLREELAG